MKNLKNEILNSIFYPRTSQVAKTDNDHILKIENNIGIGISFYINNPNNHNLLFFHGNAELAQEYKEIGSTFNMRISESSIRNVVNKDQKKYFINGTDIRKVDTYSINEMIDIFLLDCKLNGIKINDNQNIDATFQSIDGITLGLAYEMNNDAKIKIGESIAIFGCGGVGLSLIQFAKLSGCYPIIGIDIYDNKLKHALSLGATHTFNSNLKDYKKSILEVNGGSKIDICIDNTGIPEIIETAYLLTSSQGGRTLLIGVMNNNNKLKIWTYPLQFNQEIMGSSGGQCKPNIDIPRITKLIDNNLLDLKGLIAKTYNLEEINIAIDDLKKGVESGRLIIKF